MAKKYIRPEDVGPEDARIVLEFLNGAQSARQIADAIEIPGELDVGLRVAQRLLDRRAALGGRFASLAQIAAVPYVGPERFTEIVSVLTGMQPADGKAVDDFQARVLAELQSLRDMLAALQAGAGGPRLTVTLRATRDNGFVGQPIPVIVEVKDRLSGQPQPNVRLTVCAGWGHLLGHVGFEEKQGPAVTVYTDLKGVVALTFYPPFTEVLTPGQQAALETALRELNPQAQGPLDDMPALERLARRYQADNDKDLRAAIDICFSERREPLTHGVNPGGTMGNWPRRHTAITAYAHEDRQSTTTQSMAVLDLGLIDWLRPWYQVYLALCERESTLRQDIEALGTQSQESAELLDAILDHVYGFIGVQTGRVGESIGQKIARKAVNCFMASGLSTIPLEAQQALLPTLSLAAQTIRADTMGSLAVTTRIAKDVRKDVTAQLSPLGDVGAFTRLVGEVKDDLDQFQTRYGTFTDRAASLESHMTEFSTSYQKFQTDYSKFRQDFDSR